MCGNRRRTCSSHNANTRYDAFDQNRRRAEALAADAADLREIEQLEDQLKKQKP